jgi:hypothetical protein
VIIFRLRPDIASIRKLAAEHKPQETAEDALWARITPKVLARGYYEKREFLQVCDWKSHRIGPLCQSNSRRDVEVVTRAALSSPDERVRIETLTVRRGVNWPTAFALLHFGHPQPYPVIDFRALWSLGITKPPPYTFEFWSSYVEYCRRQANEAGVSVRDLDRALWQYSKVNQRRRRS